MADVPPTGELIGGGIASVRRHVESVELHTLAHLRHIFETHAGGPSKNWDRQKIKEFLEGTQHPGAPAGPSSGADGCLLSHNELDFNAFLNYMTSSHTNITTPLAPVDLSWPLASYFISSSHNTYLSGNQLSSASTTEAYTNVLLRGCRCVEIDVWDGDESDSEVSTSDDEGVKAAKESVAKRKRQQKRRKNRSSKLGSLTDKLPDSISSRLEKTSLGKKLEEHGAKKDSSEYEMVGQGKEDEDEGSPEVGLVEPRVLHGYTLTKEITFRDVCVAIRKSAFAVTDTPLIVSLEVHCSPAQQATMVQIMTEVWGEFLVTDPGKDVTELPSPQELKNKILVKVKYAPPGSSPEEYESGEEDAASAEAADKKKKAAPSKIIQELSKMGVYTRGVSFKSFTQPEASMPNHIFSLSEKKYLDFHEEHGSELWEHNKNYLMRAYPGGMRINSSNLNPAPFWGSGTQVVALNWQQTDEGMMLNDGMFAGTGGYILKPDGYRPELPSHPSPNTISCKTLSLSLTFYAGQGIPLPPGDTSAKSFEPYIKVELHVDGSVGQRGGHIDNGGHEREGEYKAKTRTHRGCDIDLAGEKIEFNNIPGLIPELTFVRFTVRDDEIGRDDLAAWACVRLDRLGDGYRFIHLLDTEGKHTGCEGVVLIKVEKKLV